MCLKTFCLHLSYLVKLQIGYPIRIPEVQSFPLRRLDKNHRTMSKILVTRTGIASFFSCLLLTIAAADLKAQQQQLNPNDFVLLSGGTGTTLIGSSITITGGSVGGKRLVQTTGNVTVNSNIHSGDKIVLTNSNVIKGNITAAANLSAPNTTILSVGSSATIVGNIDVKGNIFIGGGSVTGKVTLSGNSYIGPVPTGDTFFAQPDLPILPEIPGPYNINQIYPTPNDCTSGIRIG